ncbi:MAG TPA: response regulator [Steroidobacteraceae bacterium]|jgi:CheY-like chemotaxis protein|nr:response regulator [Steroidobacteraceae bacterium]
MTARRALVVDDSKSARAFLTRILERNDLAVDAVESAEQAIDYLAQQRPDVIFMDHLMPGMDGFQALEAIKTNPRTATIPIMMYTSQAGELYLSQARALGAIGVLPKQIKHADVSKALEQLNLRPEHKPESEVATVQVPALPTDEEPPLDLTREQRALDRPVPPHQPPVPRQPAQEREQESGWHAPERRAGGRPDLPTMPPELRTIMEAMLAHHGRELRRFVVDTVESQSDRIIGDVRLLLQDAIPQPQGDGARAPVPRLPARSAAPWLVAAGVLAAAVFALLWWRQSSDTAALMARLDASQQQLGQTQRGVEALQAAAAAAAAARAAAAAAAAAPDATDGTDASAVIGADADAASAGAVSTGGATAAHVTSMVEPVPFGDTPLAGARLEQVSQLLSRLNARGFQGVVQIRSIPGRYCMVSGPGGAPALPADAMPYSKCDQIGNPRDDDSSERQSIAFADMIATARANAGGRLDIQISTGGADEVAAPYPAISDSLTAGDWNRAAAANNRVELHWQATH